MALRDYSEDSNLNAFFKESCWRVFSNFDHEHKQIIHPAKLNMLPVIIVGAGGYRASGYDVLVACGRTVNGSVDKNAELSGKSINEVPVLGDDSILEHLPKCELANGIGSIKLLQLDGCEVAFCFQSKGFRSATFSHPTSIVSRSLRFEEGAQIMAGAVLQVGIQVGQNTIINTGAIVEHGCNIGRIAMLGLAVSFVVTYASATGPISVQERRSFKVEKLALM